MQRANQSSTKQRTSGCLCLRLSWAFRGGFVSSVNCLMIEPSLVSSCIFNLVKQILLAVVPYAALLKIIWDMPDEYPFNDKKIDTEGMVRHYDRSLVIYLCASCSSTRQLTLSFKDPNLLELTAQEMNFRSSFDAPNESIARRRSTLTLKLEAMGISTSQLNKSAKAFSGEALIGSRTRTFIHPQRTEIEHYHHAGGD